jgi:dephospho-CoA kinase
MRRLEGIVHPAVAEERAAFLAANADAPFVVFDIPLLFETGGDAHVDRIAVVSAAPEVQRARTLTRPGMTPAKFDAILARQMPDAEKRARADVIIATDVAIDQTREAVRRVIACMRAEAGG